MMSPRMTLTALGLSCAGSFLAAAASVLVLEPETRIPVSHGLLLTGLGLIFFPSLFAWLNAAALRTAPGLRARRRLHLSQALVMDINNKIVSGVLALLCVASGGMVCFLYLIVSGVQALLCVASGAVVCLYSCSRDLLRTSHYMSEAYAWFGAAYFFYDIWSMYRVHVHMMRERAQKAGHGAAPAPAAGDGTARDDGDGTAREPGDGTAREAGDGTARDIGFWTYIRHEPVILAHHIFIGGFGLLVIVYLRRDLGDCVFGFAYLMELSTPFVSLRGVLSRLRMKETGLYVANGLAMLGTFLVCRVLSLPYVCLMYSRVVNLPYLDAIWSLPRGCKISICILLLPQLYWFGLMSLGAVKVFLGPGAPAKQGKLSAGDAKGQAEKAEKRS